MPPVSASATTPISSAIRTRDLFPMSHRVHCVAMMRYPFFSLPRMLLGFSIPREWLVPDTWT